MQSHRTNPRINILEPYRNYPQLRNYHNNYVFVVKNLNSDPLYSDMLFPFSIHERSHVFHYQSNVKATIRSNEISQASSQFALNRRSTLARGVTVLNRVYS